MQVSKEIKVNIYDPFQSNTHILRQTEKNSGKFGKIFFSTNNIQAEWQIVGTHIKNIDEIRNKKIIYMHQEPVGCFLPDKYILDRCQGVISYYDFPIKAKRVFICPPLLQWTYGLSCKFIKGQGHHYLKENKLNLEMIETRKPKKKYKLCSMISSTKFFLPGHKKRVNFLKTLINHFKTQIDFFGFGFNPILDKKEAVDPYFFSIAIENATHTNWWTEKIADVFLGYTCPIYYGCPNISEFFHKSSLKLIDINDIDKSISTIEWCLKNPNSIDLEKITDSRKSIIYKYNLFKLIHDIIIKLEYNSDFKNK